MVIDKRHIDDWNELELRCPFIAERAVSYRKTGRFEFTVDLDDGTRAVYNTATKTFGMVRNARELANMDKEEWRDEFSKRLRRLFAQSFLTERELSERTGIPLVTLNRYLNGKHAPDPYNILKLARELGCSVGYLSCEE